VGRKGSGVRGHFENGSFVDIGQWYIFGVRESEKGNQFFGFFIIILIGKL